MQNGSDGREIAAAGDDLTAIGNCRTWLEMTREGGGHDAGGMPGPAISGGGGYPAKTCFYKEF